MKLYRYESAETSGIYRAYLRKAMQQGSVPGILRGYCRAAVDDPSTPADTLRTLCEKIKEFAEG